MSLIILSMSMSMAGRLIHVLPANSKLVKLFYEGDVRARDLSEQDTHDQTVDSQVQVKLGTGVVCDNLTGRYEIV